MGIIDVDKKYVANTYKREDVVFLKGKGSTLYDNTNEKYIDFGSGIAVTGLGFSNKKWKKTVINQIKKLPHTSNLYYSEPCAKLAKLLCKRTKMRKVFFGNSGAEANECAIKVARKYSFDKYGDGRNRIITLVNSFHGRTITTLSATGQDVFHNYFMPFTDGFDYVPADDFDALKETVTDKTCAVMLELVQGEGGVHVLDKEYVKKVYELCKSKDLILIIDEVQTGNGRTGTLYAYMQYDIKPDIVTTAKGLGNGLPIGACMLNDKVENVLSYGSHGSTFGGNPVASAGAYTVINCIDDKLLASVKEKSQKIKTALNSLKNVKSVSGLGLMLGIEVENAQEVKKKCLEHGLIVLTAKDKIRLLPALNISEHELDAGLNILCEVLK